MSKSNVIRNNLNLFREKAAKRGFDCSKVIFSEHFEQYYFTMTDPNTRHIYTISFADHLRLELKVTTLEKHVWLLPSWDGWRTFLAATELVKMSSERLEWKEFKEYIDDYFSNPHEYSIDTSSSYYEAIKNTYYKISNGDRSIAYEIYCDLF